MYLDEKCAASQVNSSATNKISAMETFLYESEDQLKKLASLNERVQAVADRLNGAIPEGSAEAKSEVMHQTYAGAMGSLIESHMVRDRLLNQINYNLKRIEDIV